MFKSGKIIKLLSEFGMFKRIAKILVNNISSHWSEDIKIISKLVIAKLISFDSEFLKLIDPKEKKFIDNLNLTEYSDELWVVHFDLKAD
jgi:hypothetical protein